MSHEASPFIGVWVCRYVRISTWCGTWTYRAWAKKYCVGVEDPFDSTDNCARTIAPHASSSVARKFGNAMSLMEQIDSSNVVADPRDESKAPSCEISVLSS